MLVISWNCRGLNRDSARDALRGLVRRNNPDILVLMETKMSYGRMQDLRSSFGFWGGEAVSANGLAGGFCIWWRRGLVVDIWKLNKNMVWAVIRGSTRNKDWDLFGIYGPPYACDKNAFWDSLNSSISKMGRPWLLMGDLNVILDPRDKQGGSPVVWASGSILRKFLHHSGGLELRSRGSHFTWSNTRGFGHRIRERLDRAFASPDWFCLFSKAGVRVLPAIGSDHNPILMDCFWRTIEDESLFGSMKPGPTTRCVERL